MKDTPDILARDLAAAAQAAVGCEDWAEAARAFIALFELPGRADASIAYNAGLALKRGGDTDDARRWYETALGLDPAHDNARFELGAVLLEDGQLESALDAFEKYLARQPEDPDALANSARIALKLGRLPLASDRISKGRTVAPGHVDLQLAALVLAIQDEDADAVQSLQRRLMSVDDPGVRAAALKALTQGAKGRIPLRTDGLVAPD